MRLRRFVAAEPHIHGPDHRLRAIPDPQLADYALHVRLDGWPGDHELPGDPRVDPMREHERGACVPQVVEMYRPESCFAMRGLKLRRSMFTGSRGVPTVVGKVGYWSSYKVPYSFYAAQRLRWLLKPR